MAFQFPLPYFVKLLPCRKEWKNNKEEKEGRDG